MKKASSPGLIPVGAYERVSQKMTAISKSDGIKSLREAEAVIKENVEAFYRVGLELIRIRDNALYKFDGFATWESYCRDRWEWDRTYVHRIITSAEYREKLPTLPTGQQTWSERSVRELCRLGDKKQAARVAAKVIAKVGESVRQAGKNGVKPLRMTASTVRKFVDEDLGVDRVAKAKATKAEDRGTKLESWLIEETGAIQGITSVLKEVPGDAVELSYSGIPQPWDHFLSACEMLVAVAI
ncbi:MAG: hypothetical protein ABSG53_17280 [Thermoguttaceae bacterium]